jgi:Tfp pilus tip-associated adhesin PilY1
MRISAGTVRGFAAVAILACALLGPNRSGGDDTAVFSTIVPPNVLILFDNSGSMNEIMWHPAIESQADLCTGAQCAGTCINGPCTGTCPAGQTCQISPTGAIVPAAAGLQTNCPIFGIEPPNNGGPTSGVGSMSDQAGNPMPYSCDPVQRYCRFQLHEGLTGFVNTGSYTCPGVTSTDCGTGGSSATYCTGGVCTCHYGYLPRKFCNNTRNMYIDPVVACHGSKTWWTELYDEWYFSNNATPYFLNNEGNTSTDPNMVDANQNGVHYIDNSRFALYKRSRNTAAKEVVKDVIFETDTNCSAGTGNLAALSCPLGVKNAVRFGIAHFDTSGTADGGYVQTPIADYSTTQANNLDTVINAESGDLYTPLGESLFKLYPYFMPRTGTMPKGVDGLTPFPVYGFNTSGNYVGVAGAPPDPLVCPSTGAPCACQKNFIIVITDGFPTQDDFTTNGSQTPGFAQYNQLIGDYNPVEPDSLPETCTGCLGQWRYMDDIAMYMHQNDFRPDLAGVQTLDIYTVGLATGIGQLQAGANTILAETALVGGGGGPGVGYFTSSQSQQLTTALVTQIQDILTKSQSLTAATVPASRTSDGGSFYVTEFLPSTTDPFWQGHILAYQITLNGEILDANGNCAINDTSGACQNGALLSSAVPFWDAAKSMPSPASRTLYFSKPGIAAGSLPLPWNPSNVCAATTGCAAGQISNSDLNIAAAPFPPAVYPGSNATTAPQLTDEITAYITGCSFGTGVVAPVFASAVPCIERMVAATPPVPELLGDIFHSNPIQVGLPSAHINDPTYQTFATTYGTRNRVLYAGANDGFLHAFLTGTWQTTATAQVTNPPGYDKGTGVEMFGFMPWSARATIKYKPLDIPTRNHYYVDASPHAADVWFPSTPTATTKNPTDWHTILVGGMRQGGSDSQTPTTTMNGTENSTATVSGLSSTAGLYVGETVSGAHIPANTNIATIVNATSITLTQAATGSVTEPVGFGGLNGNYYALDITNPNGVAGGPNYPGYLWEFPPQGAPATLTQYLGQTWSEPVITKVKIAVGANNNGGLGFERWVVIVGGGYDPTSDPNTVAYVPGSTLGRSLFVLDAETGQVIAQKVFSPANPPTDPQTQMFYSIASTPAVFDLNFDGFADVIYVGDLGGNVWKWSITNVCNDPATFCSNSWPFTQFFAAPAFQSTPAPAGTAVANSPPVAGDHYKSFFYPPVGTFQNSTLWVGFGTGERANLAYAGISGANINNNNRFYAMTDPDPFDQNAAPPTLHESDLLDVTSPLAAGPGNTCQPITQRGWYFLVSTDSANNGTGLTCNQTAGPPSCTLTDPTAGLGEKFVTSATIFANNVFVSSFIPNMGVGSDPCTVGGSSFQYVFTIKCAMGLYTTFLNPLQRTAPLGLGVPTDPRISISVGNVAAAGGAPCADGTANKVFVITSTNAVMGGCAGSPKGKGVGILYWREHQ